MSCTDAKGGDFLDRASGPMNHSIVQVKRDITYLYIIYQGL